MIVAFSVVAGIFLVCATIVWSIYLCNKSDAKNALRTSALEDKKLQRQYEAEADRRADAEASRDNEIRRQKELKEAGILVSEVSAQVVRPQHAVNGGYEYRTKEGIWEPTTDPRRPYRP